MALIQPVSFCRSMALWLICLVFPALAACNENVLPPGTVASVNGEPVSLHSVQALMDSRSASLGILPKSSLAEMQENYSKALATLIAHTLVRQELAERGMTVSEADISEAINQIRDDFGYENLQDYFADAFLREDEWRQLVRDHLALEMFTEKILLPSIKIPLEDIRAYYAAHEHDFELPGSAGVCFAEADARAPLAAWCGEVGKESFEPGPLANCIETGVDNIPEPWKREKIAAQACGSIVEQDGRWRVVAILKRNKGRKLELPAVYGLIENMLLEEKKIAAFDQWLRHRLDSSVIFAASGLFPHHK